MKHPTEEQLHELMDAAISHGHAEPAFFKALLDATVYAYVPVIPPSAGKLEVIKFSHTHDGEWVVPLFTSAAKAEAASADRWSVVSMPGRHFLELTRGSTLVVNPGEASAVLYPVEVDALLAGQELAALVTGSLGIRGAFTFAAPTTLARDLLSRLLSNHLASEPGVEAAYVAEMRGAVDHDDLALLVEIIAPGERAVRVVKTSAQVIRPFLASLPLPIRLTCRARDKAFLAGHNQAQQIYPRPSTRSEDAREQH